MKNILVLLLVLSASNLFITSNSFAKSESENFSVSDNIELININSATEKQLTKLPGIGKKKAKAIVEYRNNNGDFQQISDLTKVKGIGVGVLVKLKNQVSL